VDEVLAVGDAAFQRKCTGKMSDVARQGRTVVFVSHNMAALRQLCTSAILLTAGTVAERGDADTIIRKYLASTMSTEAVDLSTIADREGRGSMRIVGMHTEDSHGLPATGLFCGLPGAIVLRLSNNRPFSRVRAGISFLDSYGQRITYLNSFFIREDFAEVPPNAELVCRIPRVQLAPGTYRVELRLQSSATILEDRISDAGAIEVFDGNFYGTGRAAPEGTQVAVMDFDWNVRQHAALEAVAGSRSAQWE